MQITLKICRTMTYFNMDHSACMISIICACMIAYMIASTMIGHHWTHPMVLLLARRSSKAVCGRGKNLRQQQERPLRQRMDGRLILAPIQFESEQPEVYAHKTSIRSCIYVTSNKTCICAASAPPAQHAARRSCPAEYWLRHCRPCYSAAMRGHQVQGHLCNVCGTTMNVVFSW